LILERSKQGNPALPYLAVAIIMVGCQEMPDGALLVSDDRAGVIYRISYQK